MKFFASFLLICSGLGVFSIVFASNLDTRVNMLGKVKKKDALMHRMEVSVMALKEFNTKLAAEQLDIVLADIESFYTDTDTAKKARSLWVDEGRKTFKGEPYERAMAYYYRGLAYLIDGDYDNAYASFKGGQLQDAMAEGHDKRTDFVLLMAMQTWAAKLMGQPQLAEKAQKELAYYRQNFKIPSPETHAIVVVETGLGPRKIRDGVSGERLVFRRGRKFQDRYASATSAQGQVDLFPVEDIYYQASTRGARAIDFVNRGKAVFKEEWADSNSSIAEIAATSSLFVRSISDYQGFEASINGVEVTGGVGRKYANDLDKLALAASFISLMSSKVKAKSDTRAWSNLPDQIHIGFISKVDLDNKRELQVSLLDQNKIQIDTIDVPLRSSGESSVIAWLKVH